MNTRKSTCLLWTYLMIASSLIAGKIRPPAETICQLSYTLTSDTLFDAASSPWHITEDLEVPAGVTLTIEAGATLQFNDNTGIIVQQNGKMLAVGTESKHILLTRTSESEGKWNGIQFEQTLEDNHLAYVDMEYGDNRSNWIHVDHSKLLIESMTWPTTNHTVLELNHPHILVRSSIFPNVGKVEVVHGQSLRDDEYLILDGNTFGKTLGYNDVIDFSDCSSPGPILEAYNNTFLGGSDDGLDLDGCDAYIEGNSFTDFHLGTDNDGTSNAIATGFRYDKTTNITVVRNTFYENDHAILLKEDCYATVENNTIVGSELAAINFSEWPSRTVDPGKGAYLEGNIFWNNNMIFENLISQPGKTDPEIIANYCLLPVDFHSLGENNWYFDPKLVDPEGDFHLQPISPAIGRGPNGLDMGAYVPEGASISGEPDSVTNSTEAKLQIDGPGITHYQYCINDPASLWSEEIDLESNNMIHLTDLQDGQTYTVYVRGKNFVSAWQTQPEYATSKTWKVDLSSTDVSPDLSSDIKPQSLTLYQNTPNPCNPGTKIRFYLPKSAKTHLVIFDALGRQVAVLKEGILDAGEHTFNWHGFGNKSESCPTGIYVISLRTDDKTLTRKMLLIR